MTDLDPTDARGQGRVPTRIVRVRDLQDQAPDAVAPLAALCAVVAILGMTCMPISTVMAIMAEQGTNPNAAPGASGPVRVTLLMLLLFFLIGVLGVVGSIATMLRRNWGRRLLLAYSQLVLAYLAAAIWLRFHYGIEGLTQTAPTRSALTLNLTCVAGVMLAVAVLMIAVLRYFTLPRIARRFR